ncbi:hypothetical protein CERSUDRAFT_98919 [Gelatoporia subvermispora B]|uniref:Anaphase-promoting complex subunit 4 WD40 domain-containing protein n=1 Tax=Ceriporiopsis subvermispora (strain B) TaxID=914234 RepID=M2R3Z0_CERS8|nr:hypothetical protein CERSUDRAFT_98919 [Gelatoporia subvermispora B]
MPSPDGKFVAAAVAVDDHAAVEIWNIRDQRLEFTLGAESGTGDIIWSSNSTYVGQRSGGRVRLWDLGTGAVKGDLRLTNMVRYCSGDDDHHPDTIWIAGGDCRVAWACDDCGKLFICDVENGTIGWSDFNDLDVSSDTKVIAFAPDGSYFVSNRAAGGMGRWDVTDVLTRGHPETATSIPPSPLWSTDGPMLTSIAVSFDQKWIVGFDVTKEILILNAQTGSYLYRILPDGIVESDSIKLHIIPSPDILRISMMEDDRKCTIYSWRVLDAEITPAMPKSVTLDI